MSDKAENLTSEASTEMGSKCLIITLPVEILQKIAHYLGPPRLESLVSFTLSHPAIRHAIGQESWELVNKFCERRFCLLEILSRDQDYLRHCKSCCILHDARRFFRKCSSACTALDTHSGCSTSTKDQSTTLDCTTENLSQCLVELELSECDYRISLHQIRLALAWKAGDGTDGTCCSLLGKTGSRDIEVQFSTLPEARTDDGPELPTPYWYGGYDSDQYPSPGSEQEQEIQEKEPHGGNIRTRLRRLHARLTEVHTRIEGRRWTFYFPMTLLFFLPGSRPFSIVQKGKATKLEEEDMRTEEDQISQISRPPTPPRKCWMASSGASTHSNQERPEMIARNGWSEYYEDLARPKSERQKQHTKPKQDLQPEVRYVYRSRRKCKAGRPWYDNKCGKIVVENWFDYIGGPCWGKWQAATERLRRLRVPSLPTLSFKSKKVVDSACSNIEEENVTEWEWSDLDYESDSDVVVTINDESSLRSDPEDTVTNGIPSRTQFKRLKKPVIILRDQPKPISSTHTAKVHMEYKMVPRATPTQFLVAAEYSFTLQRSSSSPDVNICAALRNLDFHLCPHVTTSTTPLSGSISVSTIPLYWTDITPMRSCFYLYDNSCKSCFTDFHVTADFNPYAGNCIDRITFLVFHDLGGGKSDQDPRWLALKQVPARIPQSEIPEVSFPQGSVRRAWEGASVSN